MELVKFILLSFYQESSNIIYLQAHEQLRAVLLTLLEELPSHLPILLLGSSSVPLAEVEGDPSTVFPLRSVYGLLKARYSCKSSTALFLAFILAVDN